MPFLVVVAAGYAAYVNKMNEMQAKYDDSINLEGKTAIPLARMEQELSVVEVPITTISWYAGNYEDVVPYLQTRVEAIIGKNPWLGGWLIKDIGDSLRIKIYFDETGDDRTRGHFEVFEPFVIPITRGETKYTEYGMLLTAMGAMLPGNKELVGKNRPFWKVSVVPDAKAPNERFALVVSLSHAVGDTSTYYELYNMLDQDTPYLPLDPFREPNFELRFQNKVGKEEANYLKGAFSRPPIDLTGSSDEPCVYKTFYINEDWILQRKGRRGSVFDSDSVSLHREATVVSANSVITSWFFRTVESSVALMMVDMRSRFDDCAISKASAGNYVMPLAYTPADYATPGLIQESIMSLRRCGSDPPVELPSFGWNMTASVGVNYANMYRDEVYLADDVKLELHVPLYDIKLLRLLPNRVSLINIFTAKPNGMDGSERRAAAFVICRQSVWEEKIKDCGIVEEMIGDACSA